MATSVLLALFLLFPGPGIGGDLSHACGEGGGCCCGSPAACPCTAQPAPFPQDLPTPGEKPAPCPTVARQEAASLPSMADAPRVDHYSVEAGQESPSPLYLRGCTLRC
ncbi:MAG: hypothetical protein RMI39_09590 [Thermoanaerobaculum sp.]|nr:hypothetical protein [Thermoanaerobaculum sp.]